MSTIVVPDTGFLLSEEQLAECRRKNEEMEAWRAQNKEERLKKVEAKVGLVRSSHAEDPRQVLLDKYSEIIKTIPVHGPSLLVAIYRRPEKTAGGIIRPDSSLDEDIYQGKVGLVLKAGPYPADEGDMKFFDGKLPDVGDWVVFRASEGISFGLLDKKGDCRFLKDRRSVWMTIPDPELVW